MRTKTTFGRLVFPTSRCALATEEATPTVIPTRSSVARWRRTNTSTPMARYALARARVDSPPDHLDVAHGANFDAAGAGPGKLFGDLDGFVHVLRLDQIEASQDFFGFTERPIQDLGAAVADSDGLRRFGAFEH